MGVEEELLRALRVDRFALVDVLDEFRNEAVGEFYAELGEILSGLGEVVSDYGNGGF